MLYPRSLNRSLIRSSNHPANHPLNTPAEEDSSPLRFLPAWKRQWLRWIQAQPRLYIGWFGGVQIIWGDTRGDI
jgi:hypothetical protein